ncbi:transcription elongation regulator 1-like [Fagus crenata]
MALDPHPTPTTTTTTPTPTTTRPLTNTSPAQSTRPIFVQNPQPQHHNHHHHHIPNLYASTRAQNPQQGIIYPVASSGRGFIPKPPIQSSVTVANNATATTTTSGAYPPRPVVSFPHSHPLNAPVHVMRPTHHHHLLQQQQPTQLPSATNPIKGIPLSTHLKVAPSSSVSDYNGYKDPRDKSMDAFSRGKATDESLITIKDRKVNITPDASLYALCRSWLRNGISEECQPQYGDVAKSLPKPTPLPKASTHLPKKKEGEEEEEDAEDEEDYESIENLAPKDLLKRHVKHAKKVRARLREERLRRIARYKTRLGLLLPPLVEQFRNDTAARN